MYTILFYQISRLKDSRFYLRTEYILNERVSYIKIHIKGVAKIGAKNNSLIYMYI